MFIRGRLALATGGRTGLFTGWRYFVRGSSCGRCGFADGPKRSPVAASCEDVRVRICTLGDLLMDVVVRPDGVARPGDDIRARIAVGVGGQAANVAAWAAHLGAKARLVAARGDDAVGDLMHAELTERAVEVRGPVIAGPTGTVVAMLDAEGERSMMSDRGVSPEFLPEALDSSWFGGVDRLHITGYSLIAEPFAYTAMAAAHQARAAGARVSVDLSAAHLIRALGGAAFRRRLETVAPEVIFGTASEFAALDGPVSAPVIVTKRGAEGCVVTWPGGSERVAAPQVTVVDTTGAGDAFSAGFLIGERREDAISSAVSAAASCLATMGAMPPRKEPGR